MRCLFPPSIPIAALARCTACNFIFIATSCPWQCSHCLPAALSPLPLYPTLPWQAGRQHNTHTATSNDPFRFFQCSTLLCYSVSGCFYAHSYKIASLLRPIEALCQCLCPLPAASARCTLLASALGHAAVCLALPRSHSPSLPPSGLCAREWGRTACPNLHHRKFIASVLLPLPHRLLHCLLLLLRLLTRILILSTRHTFFSLHDFSPLLFVIFISSLVLRFFRFSFHWCNFSAANFCFFLLFPSHCSWLGAHYNQSIRSI